MTTLNLTAELERLIADIVHRHGAFAHIDPARLLVCVSSTRGNGCFGTFARIHPLRFEGGEVSRTVRRGRQTVRCTMPTIVRNGTEMLYVVYFFLPRFFDRPFRDKLITVFHELYHISPAFDGDIRRFPGRNFAHGGPVRRYNRLMEEMVDDYLALPESAGRTRFLQEDMAGLRERYHAIVGRRMVMPKIRLERV
jgi:predicted metallopeptidase